MLQRAITKVPRASRALSISLRPAIIPQARIAPQAPITAKRCYHEKDKLISYLTYYECSANIQLTSRPLFLPPQRRQNGQERPRRRHRSRRRPRVRRRHEAPDPSRPHHEHHLRRQVQNLWLRLRDCEFELPHRTGPGHDVGGCG